MTLVCFINCNLDCRDMIKLNLDYMKLKNQKVYGVYDIICYVTSDTEETVRKIRKLYGVHSILSLSLIE